MNQGIKEIRSTTTVYVREIRKQNKTIMQCHKQCDKLLHSESLLLLLLLFKINNGFAHNEEMVQNASWLASI